MYGIHGVDHMMFLAASGLMNALMKFARWCRGKVTKWEQHLRNDMHEKLGMVPEVFFFGPKKKTSVLSGG